MFEQFRVHLTQARGRKGRLEHQVGPTRNIKRAASQRLIHRSISMAITRDALAVAQRLCHRLANDEAGVLGRVMLIDMQVSHRLDLYVDEGMAGKLLQHMVKKTDAGRNFIFARAVEVELDMERRVRRRAMKCRSEDTRLNYNH